MLRSLKMYKLFSPNMLKTFEKCPRQFYFKYKKNISMPVDDEIFESGKNVHALASYYLKKENIDKIENALTSKERRFWDYLKESEYFKYDVINTEYSLTVKVGNYFFGGRLDALLKKDETYYILDYKTGAIPQNPKEDFQTIIYALAVKSFYKTDDVVFVYMDLKNKNDIQIVYTTQDYEKIREKLLSTAGKIEQLDNPSKKQDCRCEYSKICY